MPITRTSELRVQRSPQPADLRPSRRIRRRRARRRSAPCPSSMPSLPSSFDSGEPRCTSQIVAAMYRKNCRYSDCQFSATSTANADDVTNRSQPIWLSPWLSCSWLYTASPVSDCPSSATRKISPKNRPKPLSLNTRFIPIPSSLQHGNRDHEGQSDADHGEPCREHPSHPSTRPSLHSRMACQAPGAPCCGDEPATRGVSQEHGVAGERHLSGQSVRGGVNRVAAGARSSAARASGHGVSASSSSSESVCGASSPQAA